MKLSLKLQIYLLQIYDIYYNTFPYMAFFHFPNHILKLKTFDQLLNAGKEHPLTCDITQLFGQNFVQVFHQNQKQPMFFPKPILKQKACDQLIHARKKLFYHMAVKNYLCKILLTFLIKIESTWRQEMKDTAVDFTAYTVQDCWKQSPEVFYKKPVLKNFALSIGITYVGVSFLKSCWAEDLHFYQKETPKQVFSCEYCNIFKTAYFVKHLQMVAF